MILKLLTFITAITFTTLAHADDATVSPSAFGQIAMLVFFLGVFYLLIWRPQNKRAKTHANLLKGLATGDEVATSGGLLGKITAIGDNFLSIEIAKGTEVRVQRQAVTSALPKGTMANS